MGKPNKSNGKPGRQLAERQTPTVTPTETEETTGAFPTDSPVDPDAPTGPDAATQAEADAEAKRPRISFTIDQALKDALTKAGTEKDLPEAGIIRQAIYAHLNLEMPATELTAGTKRKYASDEERKAAKETKNDELKQILALAKLAKSKGIDLATLVQQAAAQAAAPAE